MQQPKYVCYFSSSYFRNGHNAVCGMLWSLRRNMNLPWLPACKLLVISMKRLRKRFCHLGEFFLSYSYSWGHILLIPYWYHIYEIKLILIKLNIHMCIFMKYIHDKTYIWNIIQGSDQATGQEQWSSLLAASLVQLLGMVVLVLWGVSLQNRPQTNQTQSRKKFHQCQRSCLLRFRGVLAKCLRSFLGSRSWMKTKWDCHLAFNFKYFFCSSMI